MLIRWFLTNALIVAIILVISFYRGYDSSGILFGKVAAQAAFILFLVNTNMYFVFLMIRKSRVRDVKVTLARISKKMMKYHIPFAITATILIFAHGLIMGYAHLENVIQIKILSGITAMAILPLLLYSGYRRHKKATGKRRKYHYTMAFVFLSFAVIHIFI
jgi:hypothetical protein